MIILPFKLCTCVYSTFRDRFIIETRQKWRCFVIDVYNIDNNQCLWKRRISGSGSKERISGSGSKERIGGSKGMIDECKGRISRSSRWKESVSSKWISLITYCCCLWWTASISSFNGQIVLADKIIIQVTISINHTWGTVNFKFAYKINDQWLN